MVALELIVTAQTPKWYMYHLNRITTTKLPLIALSQYATIVTLAALSFECKVVHIPPLRIKSLNMADKDLISNCSDSQGVHVPLWYSAILAQVALSFEGKVVHIPYAQNYVQENGCFKTTFEQPSSQT